MANSGYRMKFLFWLDATKEDDILIIHLVETLKKDRLFSKSIRDGISLIHDLRMGQVEVLLDLFPWVREALQPKSPQQAMQDYLDWMDAVVQHEPGDQRGQRVREQISLLRAQTVKVKQQPQVEITSTSAKGNTTTVAKNFVDSMRGFASGFFD